MSNVYHLPDREDPRAEACAWLARLERGLSEQEERDLDAWLAAGRPHARALLKEAALWDRMDSLSRLADLFPSPAPRSVRPLFRPLAFAAVVVLAVAVGLFLMRTPEVAPVRVSTPVTAAYQQVLETAMGGRSGSQLPDGTVLTLNTDSLVRVALTDRERVLTLERGEVYIRVAHDAKRPFIVRAGDKIVRAVGTAFNVEIRDDQQVEVIVTEGKVLISVARPGEPASEMAEPGLEDTAVTAGHRLLLGQQDREIEDIGTEDIDVKLAWRNGNLVFQSVPLDEALGEIERYTPVEFVIQDEQLKTIRVVGRFRTGDVDGLLATLKQNFNISYERLSGDRIILKGQ